ncbi:MAG: DUF1919 domain-containing protein [Anaeroplasmataceae bacterium]|nr:DUF1919 domain-containing protein [Anaeroplasmataceae bacterium]
MVLNKVFYKFKSLISSKRRVVERKYDHSSAYSIISCNCIGGLIYHDYHQQFLSPTINLFIESPDFIKLCKNLHEYMNYELNEYESKTNYPIGILKDIKIHFLHYKTFDEAKEKWNIRKTRINWDNIFIIMSDRDKFSPDLVDDFLKLPYKKVLFSHIDYNNEEIVYVSKDKRKSEVDDLTKYFNFKGTKTYEQYFDFDKWLTGKYSTGECKR